MSYPYKRRKKKQHPHIKRPVKKRIVVDMPRLYYVLGLFMAKERRHMNLSDLARIAGLSRRTIRHIRDKDLARPPGGMPMVNKLIAAARERGIVLHPSEFLEDVPPRPNPESSQSE